MEKKRAGGGKESPKKRGRARTAAIAAAIVLILGGVAIFCLRDYINFYGIKKLFSSFDVGNYGSSSVETIELSYDSALSPLFLAQRDGLYVATGNRITIKSYQNKELYDEMISLMSPAAADRGKYTLIYDRGGRELRLFSDHTLRYRGASEHELLAADVNSKGQLAFVTKADGYRTMVTVTDEKQNDIYRWYSAERYLSAVALSESGEEFCAVSLAGSSGDVESRLSFSSIKEDESAAQVSLPGELVFDLSYKNNGSITAITDRALYVFTRDGELVSKYEYGERVLQYFDISSEDHTVLVLGNHVYGTETNLVVLDNSLKVVSDGETGGEVDAISTDGRRILLTSGESILVFNAYGDRLDTVDLPRGTRKLIQNEEMGAYAILIDRAVPVSTK